MRGDPEIDSTVLEEARLLVHELIDLVHNRFRIAALESRLAGKSLVFIFITGIMVGVLLSCVWLGLMAATVLKLTENGIMASGFALLLAIAFNLLLTLILFLFIRVKSRYLQFP